VSIPLRGGERRERRGEYGLRGKCKGEEEREEEGKVGEECCGV